MEWKSFYFLKFLLPGQVKYNLPYLLVPPPQVLVLLKTQARARQLPLNEAHNVCDTPLTFPAPGAQQTQGGCYCHLFGDKKQADSGE